MTINGHSPTSQICAHGLITSTSLAAETESVRAAANKKKKRGWARDVTTED
jgi:hypothetical protein